MKTLKQNSFALIAAFIWGSAFVAQEKCSEYLGPFTINTLRSLVAVFALLVIILIFKKTNINEKKVHDKKYKKRLISGGVFCGLALAVASNLQQAGIAESGAGKSAFITAMYVVIVPLLGLFLHKKVKFNVWIAVAISVIGFYFLCLYGEKGLYLSLGDFFVFLCAVIFAVHILIIDSFGDVDGVELSCVQFCVVTVVSAICMFLFETPNISDVFNCILPILYIGVFSSGVAYTLQIFAQKDANPTIITLLLSLESVFAILVERVIFKTSADPLMWWESVGCALIFGAVIFSQIPIKQDKNNG